MFMRLLIKGNNNGGLYSVCIPRIIRNFAASVNINVMIPSSKKPRWYNGPEEILSIDEQTAIKYNLINARYIPLDYYLWLVNQAREDKKWINIQVKFNDDSIKKYKLSKSYAIKNNIIQDSTITINQLKKIPVPRYKFCNYKDYITINVDYPIYSCNEGSNILILPQKYAKKYNIKENTHLSWESYIKLKTKIDKE